MKVLFVFVLPSGGVDTLNRNRHKALRLVGIEAHFLYFQTGSGAVNYPPDVPVFYESQPEPIGHLLRHYRFDAIVVTSYFLELAMFRQLGYDGPIVFEVQGFGPEAKAEAAIASAAPYLNAYADALLYPETPHIGRAFRRLLPHKRIYAFPNPFDADAFAYRRTPPVPYPVLAWIGRWEDNKNPTDFLKIGGASVLFSPGVGLWMFGDPGLADAEEAVRVRDCIERLRLAPRTTYLHNVPNGQMPDYYSMIGDSGGMLVMTSRTEGAPYAALEALSCRCPVLTTDSDGVRSAIADGKTGLYYAHGDIAEGAGMVRRLMTEPALRRKLVDNGEAHVRNAFSLARYGRHFANMLEELRGSTC